MPKPSGQLQQAGARYASRIARQSMLHGGEMLHGVDLLQGDRPELSSRRSARVPQQSAVAYSSFVFLSTTSEQLLQNEPRLRHDRVGLPRTNANQGFKYNACHTCKAAQTDTLSASCSGSAMQAQARRPHGHGQAPLGFAASA
eukprot:363360-Chlamydomonas_euryale.AAC.9